MCAHVCIYVHWDEDEGVGRIKIAAEQNEIYEAFLLKMVHQFRLCKTNFAITIQELNPSTDNSLKAGMFLIERLSGCDIFALCKIFSSNALYVESLT